MFNSLVDLFRSWLRDRKQLSEPLHTLKAQGAERKSALEQANEHLKASQAELQRRWQYLTEAQRLSHSGTFGWKVRSGELVWSDETYRILGFARETSPTLDLVFDRIHPEDRDRLQQVRDHATKNGMDLDVEHRILLPDGTIKYIHAVAHAGRDSAGDLEYMGVVTDITERKRAEDEREALARDLQESKTRLEEAQRVAHIGHYEWDLVANRVTWSDELYRIYGLNPQQGPIDMAMVSDMIHPDDREHVFKAAEEAIRSGVHTEAEHRVVRPNGEVRTLLGVGTVKRDASGRAYEMFGTAQDITERKRAEEALKRSQFYLTTGERLAHMGSWASTDLGTRWSDNLGIYWSDEVYKIYGLDSKDGPPSLERYLAAIHPQDRASMAETVKVMHEQRCGCDVTKRIVRPDGEVRYIRCVGVPVVEDGVFKGFHGTTMDVTEHELLNQQLRREQAYLAEAQRLTLTGSWASNLVTRQVFHSSEENNRLYGFDVSQYPNPFDLHYSSILAEDEPALRANLENAIRAGVDFDVEYRIRRADGAIRFLRGIGHHNPSQEFGEYVGITMDITERKRAEEEREALSNALQQSNEYLAEAQSLTHAGSWACNLVTREIFHSSDENARLYGFDPNQGPIPFDRFYSTILPEDERAIRAKLENAISVGADYDVEFRIRRTDGAIRFLRGIGHHNPSQEFGEYVGITMDITERKHSEAERERLRQVEADLARINRVNMMGELAAALAHEIRQPIAASITSANALLRWLAHDPPDLERARAAAGRIEQDGNRAADVIKSLLSFYRTGTPAERQILDVKEIIGEMIVLLAVEADRHSITIQPKLEAGTPKIMANRVQLQQIFMNLMLNAIEAMKDTGGELTIRSQVNPEGHLLVSVSDTGTGLPAEFSEKIFDPFHTTKPQGTGMGLTITRSILESYGGRVWATANNGAGSTFHFILPGETEAHV